MEEQQKDRQARAARLGAEILENCRNELYRYFPQLDGAFASIVCRGGNETTTIGTEGEFFYFSPSFVLSSYVENAAVMRRGYLHMLLHCLYFHLFREEQFEKRRWSLACDMAVEWLIEREEIADLSLPENPLKEKCLRQLNDKNASAQQIYQLLEMGRFPEPIEELEKAFVFDDHQLWEMQSDPLKMAKTRQKWEKILLYTGQNAQQNKKRRGSRKGEVEEEVEEIHESRYDYRKFLRRFSVLREEVEIDTESFDYVFYNYGMEHYGNMPLIEPLEYKEVYRLEELVIAIDTSGSCSRETVQQFLAETYEILSRRENFFSKMKVVILQCDCCIQHEAVIRSEPDWREYVRNIKIHGRGGTDFRPVFRHVEKLQREKELKNLKALIYFTDGDGVYPPQKPDYETAFVFLEKTPGFEKVPDWAMRLTVD